MAVTYGRYKFITVLLLKRNGRFNSETAVRRFQKCVEGTVLVAVLECDGEHVTRRYRLLK